MARLTTQLEVATPAGTVFEHLADLRNAVLWHPSIQEVTRLDSGSIGLGSCFRVRPRTGRLPVPVDVVVTCHRPPARDVEGRIVFSTMGRLHDAEIDFRVTASSGGTGLHCHARLELRGPGLIADPFVGVLLRRFVVAARPDLERALVRDREHG